MEHFIFFQISLDHYVSNTEYPDQTRQYPVSDLGLHCLPMSHKKNARLTWVKHHASIVLGSGLHDAIASK